MTIPDDGYADGGEVYTDEEMEIILEDEFDYADCPVCGGIGGLMGELGRLIWYRCLNCGMEFYQERTQ